jgi:hypothetical protein
MGCEGPQPGSSLFRLRNDAANHGLLWTWSNSASVATLADLGDPLTTTSYRLCIYSGGSVTGLTIPAGSKWRGAGKTGYRFEDRSGSPDGITSAKVRIGSAHYPTLVNGNGVNLPDILAAPLTEPVIVQLLITDDLCYSAVYDGAGVLKNDQRRFTGRATSSSPLP